MKYNHLLIIPLSLGLSFSSYAMQEEIPQECIAYINNTPLSILTTKESLISGFTANGPQLSHADALRRFHTIMSTEDVTTALVKKLKDTSDSEIITAQKNISELNGQLVFIGFLGLSSNEILRIKAAVACFSAFLDEEKKSRKLNPSSSATHTATSHKQAVINNSSVAKPQTTSTSTTTPSSTSITQEIKNNSLTEKSQTTPIRKETPSSTPRKKPVYIHNPVMISIEQRLDFIYKYQLIKLCSYQKLSSGYTETNLPHSVENIMSLIRDPQIVEALQKKYHAAPSIDRDKAVKNLTRCKERIAKKYTSNEVNEFESFIKTLTSDNRLALKKYLLIGSIVTGGLLFAAYAVYNKYYNNTQSDTATN